MSTYGATQPCAACQKRRRSYRSADGACTKEIKRCIILARQKAVVLASIWKDRNIKTATKVKVMKLMVWAVFSMEWRDGL